MTPSSQDAGSGLVLAETRGRVGILTLNRPEALNALSRAVMDELVARARAMDVDAGIGAIVLTGSGRAFAAGADIGEMAELTASEMYRADWFAGWERLTAVRTPLVAAVAGHALGGGCELAMMCDVVLAAETARFGQPEINLGVIPGMGGSQRLTHAVGKALAMDMVLTGRTLTADEALRAGLVSRVVPADRLLEEALAVAAVIASRSKVAATAAKEAVNAAFEQPLSQGLRFERRLFHALFATEDQKEGMAAFREKREPRFRHR